MTQSFARKNRYFFLLIWQGDRCSATGLKKSGTLATPLIWPRLTFKHCSVNSMLGSNPAAALIWFFCNSLFTSFLWGIPASTFTYPSCLRRSPNYINNWTHFGHDHASGKILELCVVVVACTYIASRVEAVCILSKIIALLLDWNTSSYCH